MNFRPLPPSVQDTFDAAITDLLEDSTIFAHADSNFIEKLEAAMALCGPGPRFPGIARQRTRANAAAFCPQTGPWHPVVVAEWR
jgi:hypothetical protein